MEDDDWMFDVEQNEADELAIQQEQEWEREHEAEMEMMAEQEVPPAKRTLEVNSVPVKTSKPIDIATTANNVNVGASSAVIVAPKQPLKPTVSVSKSSEGKRPVSPVSSPAGKRTRSGATAFNPFDDSGSDSDSSIDRNVSRGKRHRAQEPNQRKGRVLKVKPLQNSMEMTLPSGRRVYVTRAKPQDNKNEIERITKAASLLTQSFASVKREMHKLRRDKALITAERNKQQLKESMNVLSEDNLMEFDKEEMLPDMPSTQPDHALWVTKYSPKRYTDLVSDESENRKVLKWLKSWDPIVFNRKKPTNRGPQSAELPQHQVNQFLSSREKTSIDEAKIVLISGPPGVGKTTLAHVAAHHCGYNVIEINASNDRSVDVFKERVNNAIQMREVLSMDKRPNCLILDEIDGSTKAAINFLAKRVTDSRSLTGVTDSTTTTTTTKKKKRKGPGPIRRPIICICNDLYAASLRPLRKIALEIILPPLATSSLTTRLVNVCRSAGVNPDGRSITQLCEQTGGDIRSCMTTIQFSSANTKEFGQDQVKGSVGQKDRKTTVYSVMEQIFVKQDRAKSRQKRLKESGKKLTTAEALLATIRSNFQYDKLLEGCFDNYLNIKGLGSFDPTMNKVTEVAEWMCFTSEVNRAIGETMAFKLVSYLPYAILAFHNKYASTTRQSLQFPNFMWSMKQKKDSSGRIIDEMLEDATPQIRLMLTPKMVVLDVVSILLDLISPYIRPVAPSLLTVEERNILQAVVGTMLGYNLNYVQVREQGVNVLKLHPPLHEMVDFDEEGGVKKERKPWEKQPVFAAKSKRSIQNDQRAKRLTNGTRQLIMQTLVQERMRAKEARYIDNQAHTNVDLAPRSKSNSNSTIDISDSKFEPIEGDSEALRKRAMASDFLKARMGIQMKQIKAYKKVAPTRDFFGREKKRTESSQTSSQTASQVAKTLAETVFFKFQEGFSTAVRKPLRLRDLL